jgi:hypothetical protein
MTQPSRNWIARHRKLLDPAKHWDELDRTNSLLRTGPLAAIERESAVEAFSGKVPRHSLIEEFVTASLSNVHDDVPVARPAKYDNNARDNIFRSLISKLGLLPRHLSIFISYRRTDSGLVSLSLYEKLRRALGERSVILDVRSIPCGVDYRTYITNALGFL